LIRIASYNVHGGIGRDRRCSPERIRDVIREIDPEVIALQEVESSANGVDMFEWLAAETGLTAIAGKTLLRGDGHYGNLMLARCPVSSFELLDLTWSRREPRGAIAADVDCGGHRVHVVATHLGLRPAERRFQVERLLKLFTTTKKDREVLLGDLNEWYLWGRPLRKLRTYFDRAPAPATFPSRHPLFALDRLYVSPGSMLKELTVHGSALARLASDHLPVVATLDLS
jgi:endonuclease/exonuclease/phosphatase family metal-dependent hydrolase